MNNLKLNLVGLLFLVSFVSCEKDCPKPIGINGTWQWEKSVSGWGTDTPELSGQKRLEIDDFYYKEFWNDSLVFESQYDLEFRDDSLVGTAPFIVFSSGFDYLIVIGEAELRLLEYNWNDGFTHYYKRK